MKNILLLFAVLLLATGASFAQGTDPCADSTAVQFVPISVTTNTQLVTGTPGKKIYVCHVDLIVASATNVAIVEGTQSTCGTNTAGMFGGSTAATGWNFAANGGIAAGNGASWIGVTATAGDNVCIVVSAANQTSGAIKVAIR